MEIFCIAVGGPLSSTGFCFLSQVQLYLSGRYDNIPAPGEGDLFTTEKSKASWELKKGNVGVFAIQGRRPHMEDRFNVVNNLEHTQTSIYGIFDGHGGEVC